MAKKMKKAAPAVKCQNPACDAMLHPRQKVCPVCGTEQHRSGKKKRTSKIVRPSRVQAPVASSETLLTKALQAGGLDFVLKAGGVTEAKKLLGEIERHSK